MSNSNIIIKYADKGDAEIIADLSRATFYETFAEQNSSKNMDLFLKDQFTKKRLMDEVGAKGNSFLLAYFGDEICGYIKLREGDRPEPIKKQTALEIARIYVCKDFIGKGVGKELMKTAVRIGQEKSVELLWLAVWEHNPRAFEFYSKWGFEIFGSQVFLLGFDVQKDWLMKKVLNPSETLITVLK